MSARKPRPPKAPPKKRVRDKPFLMYLSAEERQRFEAAAQRKGLALAQWFRLIGIEAAERSEAG